MNSINKYYNSIADTININLDNNYTSSRFSSNIEKHYSIMLDRSGGFENCRILDAGCGLGGFFKFVYNKKKYNCFGVDFSKNSINILKNAVPNANLHVADYNFLPFSDDFFDVIIFCESIGYSNNLEQTIRESLRVLKNHGRIYIKDFVFFNSKLNFRDHYSRWYMKKFWEYNVHTIIEWHKKIRNLPCMIKYLEQVGYDESSFLKELPIQLKIKHKCNSVINGLLSFENFDFYIKKHI